jgi:hypothetical protein
MSQSHVGGKREPKLISKCPTALDKRHDKEPQRSGNIELEVEQWKDIWVEESSYSSGFSLKSVTGTRIFRHGRCKNLDRDISAELRLTRAVDLTNGPSTDEGFDLKRAVLKNGSAP